MAEPKGKPPHAGEPLTREDVLRLIEEHGGPEGLDLREADLEKANLSELNLQDADLSGANLQRANLCLSRLHRARLLEAKLQAADLRWAQFPAANLHQANLGGANLRLANLPEADLSLANLQETELSEASLQAATLHWANLQGARCLETKLQGADLWQANLQTANLRGANLQGADLRRADLRRARLAWANLRDANLEGANWGDYVLGDEIRSDFGEAASAYRALKQRHTEADMYDIAGEFHYREMEARRKLAWKERRLPYALGMYALRFLYGYGERPERVIGWVVAVILGFALGHWLFSTVAGGLLDALYYSAVSFTALGYGKWAAEPQGWAGRFLGVGESLLGVFMMALFLVTFTRKMTR